MGRMAMDELHVVSTLDHSRETCLFDLPDPTSAHPIVVGLHTQSLELYNELMSRAPAAKVFLSIFDGGHEIRHKQAFERFRRLTDQVTGEKLTG